MAKKKRRIKRGKFIILSVLSFFMFVLLLLEFVSGLWLHRCYKSQNIYGNNTFVVGNSRDYATYAAIRKTGFDFSNSVLSMVKPSTDGTYDFIGTYDIANEGEPDDDALFLADDLSEDYLDLLFEKYKEHVYVTVYADINVDAENVVRYRYMYGPDSLMKSGRMCDGNGECISVNDHSIGEKIELIDGTRTITGIIKRENVMVLAGFKIPFAMYYYYGFMYGIDVYDVIHSYDEYLAWKQPMIDKGNSLAHYRHYETFVFDKSVFVSEDIEALGGLCEIMSLKDAYGRYATAYVYIFAIFPILFLGLLIFSIRRLIKSFR